MIVKLVLERSRLVEMLKSDFVSVESVLLKVVSGIRMLMVSIVLGML